ncbi:MAG TPA: thioredoxin-disulfide reductase [Dehalococcoidia bacterium]|nr:thioredoxin-disulfide reductase [Dehalococcoidia bacterium]
MTAEQREYDIIIVGGGPAGLSAGLYAARARRETLLIERKITGGQIALTAAVENYPGIDSINGFDLSQAMLKQAEKYGLRTISADVSAIDQDGPRHVVRTSDGDYTAKAVILAGGADFNKLGVPGEERLTGYGVSYCATCDGAFFKDQTVAVVGGGDAAMDEGLFVTRFVNKAYMIHRRDTLRASAILRERAFANPKMEFVWNTVVEEVLGDGNVTGVRVRNVRTGETRVLDVAAVFVFIGLTPNTQYLRGKLPMDGGGHIYVNEWMETEIPGLFAAGDIRANSARQVVTAAGDGATAAIRADHYLSERFGGEPGSGVWAPSPPVAAESDSRS